VLEPQQNEVEKSAKIFHLALLLCRVVVAPAAAAAGMANCANCEREGKGENDLLNISF